LTRRVVVTGVGLVCALASARKKAGKIFWPGQRSGTITSFDTTGFDCRIGGEIKGFDPSSGLRKRTEKDGRFIQVRWPADFAVRMSGWKPEHRISTKWRVCFVGDRRFDIIEREHGKLLNGGGQDFSIFYSVGNC